MMRENESEPDIVTAPGRPRLLIYLLVAAVAAGLGAVAVTLAQHHDPAVASTHLNQAQVEREVTPGLVDIRANLQYSHEVSVDTGIVVSADGLVLTSNNDIVGSTSVKATLVGSGRTYTARVLGYDATQDVALLKLEGAAHLSAVTLGNSSPVTTGMLVLALGNAQGQGGVTPAAGIISALDRSISSGDGDQGLPVQNLRGIIQTSAQVGPGDDGGALADSDGHVIGMITTANTSSGQQSAIGFAIPINTAMAIAREISNGQASSTVYLGQPGFLGVEVKNGTSRDPSGALIAGVIGGTPAGRAGLAAGDVITGFNGRPVTTPDSLTTLLQRYHSGDVVSVSWTAIHGATHTTHTAQITLGNGPFR
jgi:S1-C subfamily serine protease